MSNKVFSTCPYCGSNLEVYSADEGTNSFIAVDAKQLQFDIDRLQTHIVELERVNDYLNKKIAEVRADRDRFMELWTNVRDDWGS